MSGVVAEITGLMRMDEDSKASLIVSKYDSHYDQLSKKHAEWRELRNYVFATDTKTTSNAKLPWKNSTTLPKLCQIRDNLHANYMSVLFPNEDWLQWEAQDKDALDLAKSKAIKTYVNNKLKHGGYRTILSKLVYDFIDYGNVIASIEYVNEQVKQEDGTYVASYVGPRIVRNSPFDIIFNPTAPSFEESYKIKRSLVSIGELMAMAEDQPKEAHWINKAVQLVKDRRNVLSSYGDQDINKAVGYQVDGFGDYAEYLQSGYVEIHEFEGDLWVSDTNELERRRVITVVDRMHVVRNEPIPSWTGSSSYEHCGWRYRPDNLYAMGPLDNLVGMQYRIDHLENAKADFFDLVAHPPLKIKGTVEEFEWRPFAQIMLGEDGDIEALQLPSTALQANTDIQTYMNLMEEFAGAPRQAVGARTPGEKTMFEVSTLENNANKMFSDMLLNFEEFLERLMEKFLECARRNLDGTDIIAVMDDDFGVTSFMSITKEDLKANGKLRPVAARNFQIRSQMIQNYTGLRQAVGADPAVMAHISGKQEAKMLESLLLLDKFELVRDNVRTAEQLETQRLVQAGAAQNQQQSAQPAQETPEDMGPPA